MAAKTKRSLSVGVLAFHGDVSEHEAALHAAAQRMRIGVSVRMVRSKQELKGLDGLILPGGESTTLEKLLKRSGMTAHLKKVRGVFGTCAGAILMSQSARGSARGQSTLALMNITTDRNAYGTQRDSFEDDLKTKLGKVRGVFIRAPRIQVIGRGITVLAQRGEEVVACEEQRGSKYYLAASFHPELTTTLFHERFLQSIV